MRIFILVIIFSLWQLSSTLLLLLHKPTECREYHYEKPQTPFITGAVEESYATAQQPAASHHYTQPLAPTVIRTHNGNAYEVSMATSQQIYQGRLTAATSVHQVQQPHSSQSQLSTANSGGAYLPPTATFNSGVQTQYGHQSAAHSGHQYAAAYTGHSAAQNIHHNNLQYSTNANPLLSTPNAPHAAYAGATQYGVTYPATAQTATAYYPAAQGTSYHNSAQTGAYAGQSSQSATNYQGTQQQGATNYPGYSGATYSQTSQYAGGYQGQTQAAANYQSSSQSVAGNFGSYQAGIPQTGATHSGRSYATANYAGSPITGATYGTSQIGSSQAGTYQAGSYTAGNSNIGSNRQFGAADPLNGQIGDYVSQSEASQLDGYPYKQFGSGDARSYKRIITTCYPGGQCERQQLEAGQADGRHQHFVVAARARIAPVSDKCRRIAAVAGGSSNNGSGAYGVPPTGGAASVSTNAGARNPSNRPQNRRLFEYSEVVQQRDPYN